MTSKNNKKGTIEAIEPKPELSDLSVSPTEEKKGNSFPQILSKLDELEKLNNRRNRLISLNDNVNKFTLSKGDGYDNNNVGIEVLTIKDVDGREFNSRNPQLIGDLIAVIKERLQKAISETETEIVKIY